MTDDLDKVDPVMQRMREKEELCKQCHHYIGMDLPCEAKAGEPCVWGFVPMPKANPGEKK